MQQISLKNITDGTSMPLTVNQKQVIFKFKHNSEDDCWYVEVYKPDSEEMFLRTKAVCNYDLFWRYRGAYDGLPIAIIMFQSQDPTKECIMGDDMTNELVELVVLQTDEL